MVFDTHNAPLGRAPEDDNVLGAFEARVARLEYALEQIEDLAQQGEESGFTVDAVALFTAIRGHAARSLEPDAPPSSLDDLPF